MDKRADVDARAEWRVQAFCRRQNLGAGGIHFRRAFEIPPDAKMKGHPRIKNKTEAQRSGFGFEKEKQGSGRTALFVLRA